MASSAPLCGKCARESPDQSILSMTAELLLGMKAHHVFLFAGMVAWNIMNMSMFGYIVLEMDPSRLW